jgi:hypothetical protein
LGFRQFLATSGTILVSLKRFLWQTSLPFRRFERKFIMKKHSVSRSGLSHVRVLMAGALVSVSALFAFFAFATITPPDGAGGNHSRFQKRFPWQPPAFWRRKRIPRHEKMACFIVRHLPSPQHHGWPFSA